MAAFGQSEERTIRALTPSACEDCLKEFLKHYESMHNAYAVPFEGIASLLWTSFVLLRCALPS